MENHSGKNSLPRDKERERERGTKHKIKKTKQKVLTLLDLMLQAKGSCWKLLRRQGQGGCREELPHAQGQGWRLRGATPRLRSGEVAERSNPTSKERQRCGQRRAERGYSMFKVRKGSREEILLIQGKEQWLCFAGAALKRYPTSKVRETQVRR